MPVEAVRLGIGLGSNVGDRAAHLREARKRIVELPGIVLERPLTGPIFETEPVNCPPESGWFLNTVLEVGWEQRRPIGELLASLLGVEAALGRPTARERNAPRLIDLDILYAGDLVLESSVLTLPHPRLTWRRFVLAPLAAIRPELTLPGQGASVSQLLERLPRGDKVRLYASHW